MGQAQTQRIMIKPLGHYLASAFACSMEKERTALELVSKLLINGAPMGIKDMNEPAPHAIMMAIGWLTLLSPCVACNHWWEPAHAEK